VTDVDDIKYVINYDYPNTGEDYVHRIGRTGRRDRKGTAFTFLSQNEAKQANELIEILRESNQTVSPQLLEMAEMSRNTKDVNKRRRFGTPGYSQQSYPRTYQSNNRGYGQRSQFNNRYDGQQRRDDYQSFYGSDSHDAYDSRQTSDYGSNSRSNYRANYRSNDSNYGNSYGSSRNNYGSGGSYDPDY
jgi:ATP-dependent RNA helicase DDX5/DBP2